MATEKLDRRLGIVEVDDFNIFKDPSALQELFRQGAIPVDIRRGYEKVEYKILWERFAIVDEGMPIPVYKISFEKKEDGSIDILLD